MGHWATPLFVIAVFVIACGGKSTERAGSVGDEDTGGTSNVAGGTGGFGGTTSGHGGTGAGRVMGGAGGASAGVSPSGGSDAGTGGSSTAGANVGGGTAEGGGAGPLAGAGQLCGTEGCLPEPHVPSVTPPGPVMCGGAACADGETCCLRTALCFDPATAPDACPRPSHSSDPNGLPPCASNADCNEWEFCQLDNPRLCQGTGHCQPIGNCGGCGSCVLCACDGNTYPDFQTACLARTSFTQTWGAGCGESVTTGGGGAGGEATSVTACGRDADCGSGERCCSITALCYPLSDPGRCRMPPDGTSFPCTDNAQCRAGEFCAGEGCDNPGGCMRRDNDECGVTLDPVCGCDGTTYTSADCAAKAGVRIVSKGECR